MKKIWILLSVLLAGVSVCGAMEDGTVPLEYTPVRLKLGQGGVITEGSLASIQGAQRQEMMRAIRDFAPKDLPDQLKTIGITLDWGATVNGRVAAFRNNTLATAEQELAAQAELAVEEARRAEEALEARRQQEADAEAERLATEKAASYPEREIKVATNGSASLDHLTSLQLEGLKAFLAEGLDAPTLRDLNITIKLPHKMTMSKARTHLRTKLGVEIASKAPEGDVAEPVIESGESDATHQERPVDRPTVTSGDDRSAAKPLDEDPTVMPGASATEGDDNTEEGDAAKSRVVPVGSGTFASELPAVTIVLGKHGVLDSSSSISSFDGLSPKQKEGLSKMLADSEPGEYAAALAALNMTVSTTDGATLRPRLNAFLNSVVGGVPEYKGTVSTAKGLVPPTSIPLPADANEWTDEETVPSVTPKVDNKELPAGDKPKPATPPVPPVTPPGKPLVVPSPTPVVVETPALIVDENTPPAGGNGWYKPAMASAGLLAGAVALGANDVLIKENRADLAQAWRMVVSPETRALLSPMQKRRLWRVGLSAFLTFGSVAAFAVAIASALDAPKAAEAA